MQNTIRGRDMPPGGEIGADLPVRPAGGGYGASAEDIARGFSRIPNVDVDGRTGRDRSRVPKIPPMRE